MLQHMENESKRRHGPMSPADLREIIDGMAPGVTYMASELYERYTEIVRGHGRIPASSTSFGIALRKAGLERGAWSGRITWSLPAA